VPLELDVAEAGGVGDPGPDQIGAGRDHPDHEPAAPVVPDQIDRPAQVLELYREPAGVLLHRRSETGRAGAVEPGQRQCHGVGPVQRGQQAAPDGRGLGHSMDKDGGHGSHTATAEERYREAVERLTSRVSSSTRITGVA
jgi:hypothetical protein